MKKTLSIYSNLIAAGCLTGLLCTGCTPNPSGTNASVPTSPTKAQTSSAKTSEIPRVEKVLTKEERDKLTPDDVLKSLQEGNERFVAGTLTSRDHSVQVRKSALGQFPKAVILSCLDSRIPAEDAFDRGIGDVFVARVAGNFQNTDILGSMEFGCKVAGAKLILVLGHEHCGAVQSAIDNVELGNITAMLSNIRPAVEHFKDYAGEKSSKNEEFVQMVARQNVRSTIAGILEKSPILNEMESKGEIKIVGAIYNMDTGAVTFLKD